MNQSIDEVVTGRPTPGAFTGRILPKDKLDVYIDGIKHLPPSPALMVKLLGIFKQPDR